MVIINQPSPETLSEELAFLGEPRLVCRISRKTLFWGFFLAAVIGGAGIGVLGILLKILMADSPKDVVMNSIVFLPVAALLLWGGIVLCRKSNRLRHVQVVVHAGGLSYRKDSTCLTCRWDQIENAEWRVLEHSDEGAAIVGGFPIYANSKHRTHRLTVRRKDGVDLVFTDELEDVVALAQAIQRAIGPNRAWV